MCLALVKSAYMVRCELALKVVMTKNGSDEFFEALHNFHEFHFEFHNDLNQTLRPLIFDDDPKVSFIASHMCEKYFRMFLENKCIALKVADEYRLKYMDRL